MNKRDWMHAIPVCTFERRRSTLCSCCTAFRAWRTCLAHQTVDRSTEILKNCLIHFIDAILGFVKIGLVLNKKLSKLFYSLPSHCNLTKSFPRPFFSCSLLHCRYVYVTIHCRFTLKKILKNEWMITHTKRIGPLKSSRKFKSIFSP